MSELLSIPYVPIAPDRADDDAPFVFMRMAGESFVNTACEPPHRHSFHELLFVQSGMLRHSIDGQSFDLSANTLALVAHGHVHRLQHVIEGVGWAIRFTDDFLPTHRDGGLWPDSLTAFGTMSPMLALHAPEIGELNAVVDLIDAEWTNQNNPYRDATIRHLLATLLLRIGRIQAAATGADAAAREEQRIYRTFTELLEKDFVARHDVGHYATTLDLDPDRLSAVLTRLLGKPTKRVIDERLILEAKRALRYSDQTVGQIAAALGYADQFHLSKTFKRLIGVSPQAFRQQTGKMT